MDLSEVSRTFHMDPIVNAFSPGTRLRDMIRAIRDCNTAAEERAVVRKECAAIREAVGENDERYRHRNMAKLMFIHMLGYPTHFGQMECLKLIASDGFPEKRIGYLGLTLLLDERQEVLMLVTNSLKRDLYQSNTYIVGLALCALGNIGSEEMARDLAPEVEKLLQFHDPNIRKKAALCSIRIIKKVPDLAENFIKPSAALLKEKHHGVLLTGLQLCTDLCKVSAEALQYFRKKCTEGVVKTLKDVMNGPYSPEYDISGVIDPFLHIRLLKFLRMLGQGDVYASEYMNDILAQVGTKTESKKNAANAILYECVQTIMSIEDGGGLWVLAINILGSFLSKRDNNIRYVALNMLMKAVTVDIQAVQRHRGIILQCVKDSDASICKKALELLYLLLNESNVKPLTGELIEYLEVSSEEFKEDLTSKICSIIKQFPMEKIWYIDQMLKVLSLAGNFIKDEVWHALIFVITNSLNLHGYTVRSLYRAMKTSGEQANLVRVAVWCIGEYGEILVNKTGMLDVEELETVTESDAVDVIDTAMKRHNSDPTTQAMCLISLMKLSCRFPSCSQRINSIIGQYKGSLVLELQQRSIEFNSIIKKHQNIRPVLLERMPVLDEATYSGRKARCSPQSVSMLSGAPLNQPNGVGKPTADSLVNLLDMSSDETPAPSSSGDNFLQDLLGAGLSPASSQRGTDQAQKSGRDILLDLLSVGTSSDQSNTSQSCLLPSIQSNKTLLGTLEHSSPPSEHPALASSDGSSSMMDLLDGFASNPAKLEDNGPAHPSLMAYESSSLKIMFNFAKLHGNPQTTFIEAVFTNKSPHAYTNFIFQAAVPKFLQLHLHPASSNTLPASGSGAITQNMRVVNTQHGKKSLVMRMRIGYMLNGKDVCEEGQINNFPRELQA